MVSKNIIVTLFVTAAAAAHETGAAQKAAYNTPGAGNPILPGYFADPTSKKFGDTYYIYATTDGSGAGFGPAQLWCSKDFKNWTLMPMNWPDSHWIWAPDVMQNEADGKYYYLYCQPCKLQQRLVAVQTDQKRAFLIFLRGIRRADEHLAIRAFNGIHPGALRKFVDRSNLGQMHTIHTADIFAQKCRLYAGCVTVFRPNSRHRVKPHGT